MPALPTSLRRSAFCRSVQHGVRVVIEHKTLIISPGEIIQSVYQRNNRDLCVSERSGVVGSSAPCYATVDLFVVSDSFGAVRQTSVYVGAGLAEGGGVECTRPCMSLSSAPLTRRVESSATFDLSVAT